MTTLTPRQAALERLATALKDRWYQIADTEVIDHHLSRAWDQLADAALAAVEQAAPEEEIDRLRAFRNAVLSHDPDHEDPDTIRGLYAEQIQDLAAARVAIREASIVRLANHSVLLCAPPNLCETCQWLASPAVVAARLGE